MCIFYYADRPGCHCIKFLGLYACHCQEACYTVLAHPHNFYLEEPGFDCEECIANNEIQLDPNIVPVQYYPPIKDFDIEFVKEGSYERVVKVEPLVYQRSEGSLSDVDSVTSHWKEDRTAQEADGAYDGEKSLLYRGEKDPPTLGEAQMAYLYTQAAQQQSAVQDWLGTMPQHPAPGYVGQYGSAPYTTMHRNLVQGQLANLPSHLSKHRKPSKPVARRPIPIVHPDSRAVQPTKPVVQPTKPDIQQSKPVDLEWTGASFFSAQEGTRIRIVHRLQDGTMVKIVQKLENGVWV
ncbi:Nn.00g090060.m01.CDS01 [Neocucurbitaria sp. VM-36]